MLLSDAIVTIAVGFSSGKTFLVHPVEFAKTLTELDQSFLRFVVY